MLGKKNTIFTWLLCALLCVSSSFAVITAEDEPAAEEKPESTEVVEEAGQTEETTKIAKPEEASEMPETDGEEEVLPVDEDNSLDKSVHPEESPAEKEENVTAEEQVESEQNPSETDKPDPNPAEKEESEYVSTAETISGTCGDTISWAYDTETYVLSVTGTGDMPDYSSVSDVPWAEYNDVILEAIVGDGITGIGNYAFAELTEVTKITLSDTITKIGFRAFFNDTQLQQINIPLGWTSVGSDSSTIDATTSGKIFEECQSLNEVTVPEGVTAIPSYGFDGCNYLTKINLPKTLTAINNHAFYECSGMAGFSLPEGINSIGKSAFCYCTSLQEITFPDGVTSLGNYVLYGNTSLTTIKLPDSVDTIGYQAFAECPNLESINIPKSWTTLISDDSDTVSIDTMGGIFYNDEKLLSVTVKEGVTELPGYAFNDCNYLETIILPNSLTEIPDHAFSNCTSLKEIDIPDGVTAIRKSAFYNCDSLITVTIPKNVTVLYEYCFANCDKLDTVTLPDSLETIYYYAFGECVNLKNINIPTGWKTVGTYGDETPNQDDTGSIFYGCSKLQYLIVPKGITELPAYAFNNCDFLKTVVLPGSLQITGEYSFADCSSLFSMKIPDNVTTISSNTFSNCTSLSAVSLSDSISEIGNNAFDQTYSDLKVLYAGSSDQWAVIEGNTNIPASNLTTDYAVTYQEDDFLKKWGGEYDGYFNDTVVRRHFTMDLSNISPCGNVCEISGRIVFSPAPSANTVYAANGSYYFAGLVDISTGAMSFQGKTWIQYPAGYEDDDFDFMTFDGFLSENKEYIYGINANISSRTYLAYSIERGVPIIVIPGVMGSELYDYAYTDTICGAVAEWKKVWVNDSITVNDIPTTALWNVYGSDMTKPSLGVGIISDTSYITPYYERIDYPLTSNTVMSAALIKEPHEEDERNRISEYGTLDKYKNLIDTLCEEYPDRDVYFYAYDWRKSNAVSADHLYQLMDRAKILKADILAHSMGGLVLSHFVNQNHEGMINHSITFGTPYEGANKLLNAILTTTVTGTFLMDETLVLKGLDLGVKKQFTGVAELSPTEEMIAYEGEGYADYIYAYDFSVGEMTDKTQQGLFLDDLQIDSILQMGHISEIETGTYYVELDNIHRLGFTELDDSCIVMRWMNSLSKLKYENKRLMCLCGLNIEMVSRGYYVYPVYECYVVNASYKTIMKAIYGKTRYSAIVDAQIKARAGYTKLQSMDNAFFAIGKTDTMKTVTGLTLRLNKNGNVEVIDCLKYKNGDGTVPFYSANQLSAAKRTFPKYSYYKLTHGGLAGDLGKKDSHEEWSEDKTWLLNILDGRYDGETATGSSLYSTEDEDDEFSYKALRFDGDVEVTITSGEEYLSNAEGSYCDTASFGSMETLGETGNIKMFFIDEGTDYTVTCKSKNDGVVDFTESEIINGEEVSAVNYPCLIVQEGSNIILNNEDEIVKVDIDNDNDGIADITLDKANVEYSFSIDHSEGGLINPNNTFFVSEGTNTSLTIKADEDYCISYILINGERYTETSVNGLAEFTMSFESVSDNYNVFVQFRKIGEPDLSDIGEVLVEDIPADGIIPEGIWIAGIKNQMYTASAIKPDFRVYDGKTLLKNKTDYTITYKNNTKAYTIADPENPTTTDKKKAPQIIIKSNAKGNYKGSKTVYFTIDPFDLNDEQITVDELSVQATGKTLSPVPVVYFNGKKLKAKTDYTVDYNGWDQKTPGDHEIIVKGKGNFEGTREATVHVASSDLTAVSKLTVSTKAVKYADLTGNDFLNEIASAVTVKNGKKVIPADSYSFEDIPADYKNVGTIRFTLIGNEYAGFYGKRTVTVKITGISLTDKKVKAVTGLSYPYTGEPREITSDISLLAYNGTPLTEGTDYEITGYTKNLNAGTATVTVKGINNYTGTKKVSFKITPITNPVTDERITIEEAFYCKGGSKPTVTIEGMTVNTDYTLKYTKNTKADTEGTVTITFKGNYKGTPSITKTFRINPKDISTVSISSKDKVYSNKANAWKSAPVLKDTDGKALKAGTDYEKIIVYTTEYDEALPSVVPADTVIKVTVTGKGNYTRTAETCYRILETGKDISKLTFKIANQEYTGSPVTIDEGDITSIKLGKKVQELVLGTDYEIVSYTNNINKGTAKVTFRGIGEYGGTKTVSFKIGQRSIVDYWNGVRELFESLF